MMNEILITCWIILMMWCVGNTPSLKVNKKPELDNYIAMIHLFVSNWDEWEENGVICYTEQPSTIQQARMEGKWIDVKVTCAGGTHDIVLLDFR